MRIAAALCWYNEPIMSMERCVKSLAGFADTLVSLDGAYKHFLITMPTAMRHVKNKRNNTSVRVYEPV